MSGKFNPLHISVLLKVFTHFKKHLTFRLERIYSEIIQTRGDRCTKSPGSRDKASPFHHLAFFCAAIKMLLGIPKVVPSCYGKGKAQTTEDWALKRL